MDTEPSFIPEQLSKTVFSSHMTQREDSATSLRPEVRGSLTIVDVLRLPVKILKICGTDIDVQTGNDQKISTWKLMFRRFYFLILTLILSCYSYETVNFLENYPESKIIQAILNFASKIDFIIFPVVLLATTKQIRRLFLRFTDYQTELGFAADVEKEKTAVNRKLVVLSLMSLLPAIVLSTLKAPTISNVIELFSVWYINRGTLNFRFYPVYHVYLTSIAVSMFTILSNMTAFIIKEYQDVRIKVKAFQEDNNITTSKLERLRRQQQKAHNLLRKCNCLAKTYANATLLTILMKIFVFMIGNFYSQTDVLENLLYNNIFCEVSRVSVLILTALWISKMTKDVLQQVKL